MIIGLRIGVQLYANSLLITVITFVVSSILLFAVSYPSTSQFRYSRFNGELDGNYESIDLNEVGHALFKEIGEDGVVKNLRLRNQQVDSGDEIGAVANVNNGVIRQVIVEDSVVEGRDRIGGLVGVNKGCIDNCIVNSTTVRGRNVVGGFVGLCSDSYTRHCQAYNCEVETDSIGDDESYGGGFAGGVQNKSIVMDCHASGSIQGEYTGVVRRSRK